MYVVGYKTQLLIAWYRSLRHCYICMYLVPYHSYLVVMAICTCTLFCYHGYLVTMTMHI